MNYMSLLNIGNVMKRYENCFRKHYESNRRKCAGCKKSANYSEKETEFVDVGIVTLTGKNGIVEPQSCGSHNMVEPGSFSKIVNDTWATQAEFHYSFLKPL